MIVCVCNGLSERDCRSAASSGRCRTVNCIYRACGGRVRCGRCLPMMREIFASHAANNDEPARDRAEESVPQPG